MKAFKQKLFSVIANFMGLIFSLFGWLASRVLILDVFLSIMIIAMCFTPHIDKVENIASMSISYAIGILTSLILLITVCRADYFLLDTSSSIAWKICLWVNTLIGIPCTVFALFTTGLFDPLSALAIAIAIIIPSDIGIYWYHWYKDILITLQNLPEGAHFISPDEETNCVYQKEHSASVTNCHEVGHPKNKSYIDPDALVTIVSEEPDHTASDGHYHVSD